LFNDIVLNEKLLDAKSGEKLFMMNWQAQEVSCCGKFQGTTMTFTRSD
jgi:hypothetical protein